MTSKFLLFAAGFQFLNLVTCGSAIADDEIPHGLLAEYSHTGETVRRVDPDLAFVWNRAAPDPRLENGPFHAAWTGQVLIRAEASYTFHAYVQGEVKVSIDGDTVLTARNAEPRWVSGEPVELGFGFNALDVDYERTNDAGRLQVFWSSEQFPLEPVPGHLLFRADDEGNDSSETALMIFDQGRQLFDAFRCQRCHQTSDAAALPPAPALTHVASGTDSGWLLDKLQHQHTEATGSKMPVFGFSEDDARAVVAFLLSSSQPADLLSPPRLREKQDDPLPDGEELLYSTGCLACHRIGEFGTPGPFDGGDLTSIGNRRSRDWLYTKLTEQSRLGAHHRMPVFDLSREERVQIVDALVGLSATPAEIGEQNNGFPSSDELVGKGRQLFINARCFACHDVSVLEPPDLRLSTLDRPIDDWSKTCLSETPDRASLRPAYPHADLDALRNYVSAMSGNQTSLADAGDFKQGRRVLERRNCLSCHERDVQTGIVATAGKVAARDSRLSGQSQALIPPSLTAVGDKLLDDALAEAVRGAQKTRRMPWLSVRMPRFEHSEEDQQALLAYLIGHDRIPDGAPDSGDILPATDAADEQTLLAGQNLVGAGGFSCIACHEFGDYVPPNVAIATHGSDLLGLSGRLRPEYFMRWTRSPLRIVPGMEMPSYERPVPGILDGNVHRQLSAIWKALNDPRFTTPTNPTAVEQLLVVGDGQRPRIVRDVFIVPEDNGGGYVPRAMAVGFANGHSLLLDLDSGSIRGWTIGEFALQETQGKSWFWKLAGAPVAAGLDDGAGLRRLADAAASDGEPGKLSMRSYSVEQDSLTLNYTIRFATDDDAESVDVEELWSLLDREGVSGVRRTIAVHSSDDSPLLLAMPQIEPRLGQARIVSDSSERQSLESGWQGVRFAEASSNGTRSLTVDYVADVNSVPAQPIPAPEVEPEYLPVTTAPGNEGVRLRLPESIMPTALSWRDDGTLVFTSLKGHVFLAHDTNNDGIEDSLTVFEEGLAAPFGVLADGDDLLVAHKAELLRLRDIDGDGHCDERIVEANGWGYTHDYHDWVTGPVRDAEGNLYLATGSDYAHRDREESEQRWRGKVLRINTAGELDVFAHELRYPVGIALDGHDRLFVSDQQGVANTFNEINHVQAGGRYGVKSQADPQDSTQSLLPAVQIPHPWTRSVNGIFFLPERLADGPFSPFAGQGVGCEFNGRFLVRFSLQEIDGQLQGATYELTRTTWEKDSDAFLGPICGAVSPAGDIYVGSLYDSGWLGGRNTGEIVRLRPEFGAVPQNGIREVRAVPAGFEIEFISAVDRAAATEITNYSISGYTRIWEGSYATPDSGRYTPSVRFVQLSENGRIVTLAIDDLRSGFVYEISSASVPAADGTELQPATAHYTMNRVPR